MDLIVVGFQGRYRAAQVLTELRQRGLRLFELDQAITISWEDRRNFIVQQSVNLWNEAGSRWARLWGAFISATLFQPFTERLANAATDVGPEDHGKAELTPDRDWWVHEIGIPDDFIRDVGALIQPGESAIITLAEKFEPDEARRVLRDLGGSIVHASLSDEQMEKVHRVLNGAG